MKDGIIKGNGNSRYLKSVADFLTQYPTYEAFAAALTAGTLPVDLNGINEDGWQQIGDLLNKGNLFADPTAAVFADNVAAVPNDGIYFLAMALGAMEQGKGVLLVYATTPEGEPVAGQTVSVSQSIGTLPLNAAGAATFLVSSGTYTVSCNATGFYTPDALSKSVTVTAGKISVVHFACSIIPFGTITIEQSTEISIPKSLTSVDIFAAGGGGSGGAGASGFIGGGGGGYTKTLKNQNFSGKTLKITIGAGGKSVSGQSSGASNSAKHGNDGGATTITVDGAQIITANGGIGGNSSSSNEADKTGNGGSGGGYSNYTSSSFSESASNLKGGTDGSDGASDNNPGKGQGTTTRAFEDPDGLLCSSGGGGAWGYAAYTRIAGAAGDSGGGNGLVASSASSHAGDATVYGGGGGAVINNASATSGAGHDGVVMIRWGVAA